MLKLKDAMNTCLVKKKVFRFAIKVIQAREYDIFLDQKRVEARSNANKKKRRQVRIYTYYLFAITRILKNRLVRLKKT